MATSISDIRRKNRGKDRISWVKDCRQENYYSQDKKNTIVISTESCIKRIKLSDLESKILIIRNLEYDCSLVISKN